MEFVEYLLDRLRAYKGLDVTPVIGLIRRRSLEEGVEVSYVYNEPQASLGMYRTVNTINISKGLFSDRPLFSATLVSQGDEDAANRTGQFLRRLVIEWSTKKRRNS